MDGYMDPSEFNEYVVAYAYKRQAGGDLYGFGARDGGYLFLIRRGTASTFPDTFDGTPIQLDEVDEPKAFYDVPLTYKYNTTDHVVIDGETVPLRRI